MPNQLKSRSLWRLFALPLLLLFLAGIAAADPGDPEHGFGGDGRVTTTITYTDEFGYGVARQPDGKIIVAGQTGTAPNLDFVVARYNPDGSTDLSFGSTGAAFVDFGGDSDIARAVAVQPDGKIVVAGRSYNGANIDFAVARLNADGSLDNSFGGGLGYVTTDFTADNDRGLDVLLQADGKIVVTGDSRNGPDLNYALARYNPDGSLDNSFDLDGRVTTDFVGGQDFGRKSVLQDDGKIIMVGEASLQFGLARYNPDGSLDAGFGIGGKVRTPFAGLSDYGEDVVLAPDGKVVATGRVFNGVDFDFGVARYNPDGSLDNSFHFDGRQVVDLGGNEEASAVQVQPDGKVLVGGGGSSPGSFAFALARLNANGTLDAGYGVGGSTVIDFTPGTDAGKDLVLQPDGRAVLAGYAEEGDFNFALARFNDLGQLDPNFDTGKVITDFTGDSDTIRDLAVQDDGKIVAAGYTFNGADFDFALARYLPMGRLDGTFGTNGRVTTDFFGNGDFAEAVLVQDDGKIVVAGTAYDGASNNFALARYNPDGTLDNTFGFGGLGISWMDFNGGFDQGLGLARQADGKYLVGGTVTVGGGLDFGVGRFQPDGSFDFSFDGDARANIDFGNTDFGKGLLLQPDGKIVVPGSASMGSDFDIALARLNSNGSLDNSFHFDGRVTTDIAGDDDFGEDAVLYPDGDIIVAGASQVGPEDDTALLRYNPDGSLDAGFGSGGVVVTDLGVDDYAYRVLVRPDGYLVAGGGSLFGPEFDFTMAQYHPDGTLDLPFGDNGIVRTDFARQHDFAYALAFAGDSLLLAGQAVQGGSAQFALARYEAVHMTYIPILSYSP